MKALAILTSLFAATSFFSPVLAQTGWGTNVPNELNFDVEGNSSTLYPFSFGSTRYQQAYGAESFASAGSAGVLVTQAVFRLDNPLGFDVAGVVTNMQINLSTTARQPDSLSPVFVENVGLNDTVVWGPKDALLVAPYHSGREDPQPFLWLVFRFDQEFLYEPSAGSLLMEIRLWDNGVLTRLDAADHVGDSVSSVFGGLNDPSGTVSTLGVATFFSGTVVPEPTPIFLMLLATSAVFLIRRRRK